MKKISKRHCERSEAIYRRKWIAASLLLLAMTVLMFHGSAIAQEEAAPTTVENPAVDADYDRRIELAKKMHEFRPVRDQVNGAIDQYAQTQPPAQREAFKTTMRNVINYKALEKISVDAYAETFTVPELEAMVEYYAKPEARSASDKFAGYANIVSPEITRMLDKALIRVRTGGQ